MKNVTFIALAFLSILACKKPTNDPAKDPEKPQQTQTGADILWCKVNGTPHLYKVKPTTFKDNGVHAYQLKFADSSVVIEIFANDSKYGDGLDMYINVTGESTKTPSTNTNYKISDNHPHRYSDYYKSDGSDSYKVDSNSSYITFTRFDNTVAAGTFEYHGFNKNNDTVHITDGFFDIVRE